MHVVHYALRVDCKHADRVLCHRVCAAGAKHVFFEVGQLQAWSLPFCKHATGLCQSLRGLAGPKQRSNNSCQNECASILWLWQLVKRKEGPSQLPRMQAPPCNIASMITRMHPSKHACMHALASLATPGAWRVATQLQRPLRAARLRAWVRAPCRGSR